MRPIIKVENLSKQYHIGAAATGAAHYRTLRDSIASAVSRPFRKTDSNGGSDYFWALKDVSFAVKPGEVVGVIGSNGSGKSTLLKILSRITKPTTGRVELYGHVASLLEVGTGFHPDLTGRENVFLNGAILGMKREEIESKFDEIVAFAEVDRFLDTPVKHYSSGMYVRLAFAVAAHLDPDILIVDEVLAVGDLSFQNKCLGKMDDVTRSGRTVIVVSHSMRMITDLCDTVILLEDGQIKKIGSAEETVDYYQYRSNLKAASRVVTRLGKEKKGDEPGAVAIHEKSRSFPACFSSGAIRVSAPEGMNWTAVSNDDFIVIVSGSSGSGNGEVVYHVAANTGAAIRSGAITVAGLTYNVLQGVDFLDVPASHPAYAEIGKLSAQGIVFGFGGRTFRPDEPTTRSQAAGLLAKALGELEPPPPARQRFADVSPDHPAFVSIDLLAERNILPPEQSEFFHPDEPVTQGQVAALIIRALGELAPPSPLRQRFPDVLPANPYASYIERMAALGITEIKDGDLYRPDAPVTRSQMAALLVRAFNL